MKYRGLIITMIVMLSIIIVLLLGVLYLGINNTGFIQLGFFSGNKADKIIYDKGYDVGLINNIEVLSSAGDVKIEESNDSNVRVLVYGKEDDGLRVDLENGNLKVDYREHHKHHIISFGGYLSEIIIYVPKTYDKNLDLKLDYGDLDITSIENASIKVNESCGDIKAGKVKNIEMEELGKEPFCIAYSKNLYNLKITSIKDLDNLPLILPISAKKERSEFDKILEISKM